MNVWLAKDAQKQYKKLPKPEQAKIRKRLDVLSGDPYAGKKLEGILKKRRSMRAWPYRIIYSINKSENKVEISDILHRQGAYK
jgi:mRNA-degrading endonuclease RelE of RelBE toxin-antitoxin system